MALGIRLLIVEEGMRICRMGKGSHGRIYGRGFESDVFEIRICMFVCMLHV